MSTSSEFRDECQTHRRATQCAASSNRGLTLFHCHQQLHMDFGFMTLFDYV
jgi:FtsP/CotA-like multicopper oxidase with cupredoxin domain